MFFYVSAITDAEDREIKSAVVPGDYFDFPE
jgi:hypothetical protein